MSANTRITPTLIYIHIHIYTHTHLITHNYTQASTSTLPIKIEATSTSKNFNNPCAFFFLICAFKLLDIFIAYTEKKKTVRT